MRLAALVLLCLPAIAQPPLYWFVRSGQSLSRGAVGYCNFSGYPACSDGLTGNVMLGTTYPPAGAFQLLEEFAMPAGTAIETSATAACNQFSSSSGKFCGTANYGWPGASYQALKKGGTGCTPPCMYDNSIGLYSGATTGGGVVQAKLNAEAAGQKLIVGGVYFNQGEAEMNGTTSAATYRGYMEQLQADYEADIKAVTGQTGRVPLFIVQKSSWGAWAGGRTTPTTTVGGNDGVPIGQLQAALNNYSTGKIFIVAPDYATAYGADGIHKPAEAYRKQGAIEGKVMNQVVYERRPWRPFHPRSITLTGNLLRVRFWVPYGSLIFDETNIAPLPDGHKGFEVTDTGGSGRTITSVALTAGQTDSIDITLSGTPSSTVELRYAWTAAGTGAAYAGPINGPRGNVADTDDRTSWNGDPLRDYALTFRIGAISTAAPYTWEPADPPLTGGQAMSNAVRITNRLTTAQTSRTWNVHRYFADKEICGYPQPYINGTSPTYWQSNVEVRWPADSACAAGYVKTAFISWEATIQPKSTMAPEFRTAANACHLGDEATCTAAGLTKTQMLAFDAGAGAASWGLKTSITTGGISQSASSRTMLNSNQYRILHTGPIWTNVLMREGPDSVQGTATRDTNMGVKCDANCTAPYDSSTWSAADANFRSIRPSFLVQYFTRWGRVAQWSLLHNGWRDRYVDQRVDSYTVMKGGGEDEVVYTAPAGFVIPAGSQVMEGPIWSTDPNDYTSTTFDLNSEYMVYSGAIPPFDLSTYVTQAAVTNELTRSAADGTSGIGFDNTDQGATTTASIAPHLGWGQWERAQAAPGGGHWVGLIPRGYSRLLYSWHPDLWRAMEGNVKAAMHFPIFYLDSDTTTTWNTIGGFSKSNFGMPISLQAHTSFAVTGTSGIPTADAMLHPGTTTRVAPVCATCMVACSYKSGATLQWCGVNSGAVSSNAFAYDRAHTPGWFYVPYLLTGNHFYLEDLWQQVHWAAAYSGHETTLTNRTYGRVGWYGYGIDTSNMIRSAAWTRRQLVQAIAVTPSVYTAERDYWTRQLNAHIEIDEGRYGIIDGAFPPPDPSNANGRYGCPIKTTWTITDPLWCIGRHFFEQGWTNGIGSLGAYSSQGVLAGRSDRTYSGYNFWIATYQPMVFGHALDLGFTSFRKLMDFSNRFFIRLFLDPAGFNGPSAIAYNLPNVKATNDGYLDSFADMKSAKVETARIARLVSPGDTSIRLSGYGHSQQGNISVMDSIEVYFKDATYWQANNEVLYHGNTRNLLNCTPSAVDAATDRVTCAAAHPFQSGDLVHVRQANGADSQDLAIANGGSRCLYGKKACDFYATVIDSTTLELYLDSARTVKVDWIGTGVTGMSVTQIEILNLTRGRMGTAAATHDIDSIVTRHNSIADAGNTDSATTGVQNGHTSYYYSALAYAAEYGTVAVGTDGKPITGRRAYEIFRQWHYGQWRMGGAASCSGLRNEACGNPMFSWMPRSKPRNIRVAGSRLHYTAPDGNTCGVEISATPFTSSGENGVADAGGMPARSVSLAGYSPGTYYYRIDCGARGARGRASGSVVVQ